MINMLLIILGILVVSFNEVVTRDVVQGAMIWRRQEWSDRKFLHMRAYTALLGFAIIFWGTMTHFAVDPTIKAIVMLGIILPAHVIPFVSK